jgi:16S rRNA (guanine(966)-N(2))-methyltransferase RsmD
MIRITGGKYRSRLIETPNTTLTKPTMDKVREAVFSALSEKVYGARVLDLFAGSGSYGLEALSRGAKEVTFVDSSPLAVKAIKENCEKLNEKNVEILNNDVLAYLSQNPKEFDIIFADPPYKLDVYKDAVETLIKRQILASNGIIVLESERELNIDESSFSKVRFYKYGLAKVYILRK